MEAFSKNTIGTLATLATVALVATRFYETIAAAPVGGTLVVVVTLGLVWVVWRNSR